MIGFAAAAILVLAAAKGDVSALEQRVVENDYRGAIELAKELGPEAGPTLERHAHAADAAERTLALFCLEAAEGNAAAGTAARALSDSAADVRAAAMQVLSRLDASDALPDLVHAAEESGDPTVRRAAILTAGRAARATPRQLATACRSPGGPNVEDACTAALAKLGDTEAKKRFIRLLSISRGNARTPALDLAEYVRAAWLLDPLRPFLSDKTPSLRIGADGLPAPENLRVCDRAVNLIAQIAQPRWSFTPEPDATYTDAQLAEVRRWSSRRN